MWGFHSFFLGQGPEKACKNEVMWKACYTRESGW